MSEQADFTFIADNCRRDYGIEAISRKDRGASEALIDLKSRKLSSSFIGSLVSIVTLRDGYTAKHQNKVARLASSIGSALGLCVDTIEGLWMGGMVHDIGKLAIPSAILNKSGTITALEYDLIKTHTTAGYQIVKDLEIPWPIGTIIHQHHERIDGSGYPNGLAGDRISLEARVVAVADVFDSMTSHRTYRPALGVEAAINELTENSGTLYDSDVVAACIKQIESGIFDTMDHTRTNPESAAFGQWLDRQHANTH